MLNYLQNHNVNKLYIDNVKACWLCLKDAITNMMENFVPKVKILEIIL